MASDPNHSEMEQVNRIFETDVVRNRNFNAIERVYTAQARILPPGGEMLTGLDHIRNFWEQAVSTLNIESLTLSTLDMQVSGDRPRRDAHEPANFPNGGEIRGCLETRRQWLEVGC